MVYLFVLGSFNGRFLTPGLGVTGPVVPNQPFQPQFRINCQRIQISVFILYFLWLQFPTLDSKTFYVSIRLQAVELFRNLIIGGGILSLN